MASPYYRDSICYLDYLPAMGRSRGIARRHRRFVGFQILEGHLVVTGLTIGEGMKLCYGKGAARRFGTDVLGI